MDFFTREELQSLLAGQHGLAVSIFLPTHRAGREIRQDPIRLKNLLRRAEAALIASNLRRADARELLAPARELVERKHFWRYQDSGLAASFDTFDSLFPSNNSSSLPTASM
jgi:hypothetical protein